MRKLTSVFALTCFLVFLVILLGCTKPVQPQNYFYDYNIGTKINSHKFGFGVGFVEKQTAYLMNDLGANWAKVPQVTWAKMEPKAPQANLHYYNWNISDAFAREWTDNGFEIQLVIKTHSEWGTIKPKSNLKSCGIVDTNPKEENWDDYTAFLQRLAERYDFDGLDDMPNLKKAINYFEIGSEMQHEACYEGTPQDYIKLLRISSEAIKKANPNAKIILSGIAFGDLFDDFPSEETFLKRANYFTELGRDDLEFIKETLKAEEYYDYIEFHHNRDYKALYGTLDFIKKYSSKPIWAGDTASGAFLKDDVSLFVPLYEKEIGVQLFNAVASSNNPNHELIKKWYRADQAKLTAKKLITGMNAGLVGMNIENISDWGTEWEEMGLGNFMFIGLVDENKNPKPAYYAYKQIIDTLGEFTSSEMINYDGNVIENKGKGTWLFKFNTPKREIFVSWLEDNYNDCPICTPPTEPQEKVIDLSDYISGEVKVTPIFTKNSAPESSMLDSNAITITETPVFITSSN